MICYKDRCFCAHSEAIPGGSCHNQECDRNYTEVEDAKNVEIGNLPISFDNFKTDDCGYEGS